MSFLENDASLSTLGLSTALQLRGRISVCSWQFANNYAESEVSTVICFAFVTHRVTA